MECKLFQTAKYEINYTVWKQTSSGFKLSQHFFYDNQHWVVPMNPVAKKVYGLPEFWTVMGNQDHQAGHG